MSLRKDVLSCLLKAHAAPTYDELLTATGATRHNLSNTLHDLKRDGIVESVPETFLVGAAGRAKLQRQADAKAENAQANARRMAERKRLKRAEARIAAKPVPLQPAPRFVQVARVPVRAPNSVFDLARFA